MSDDNTRHTKGIVSDETDAAKDADVIMTAAVVGFSAKLISEGKPVRFDTQGIHAGMNEQDKKDARDAIETMFKVVEKINRVLEPAGFEKAVQSGTSPAYDYTEKVIFGVKDGDRTDFFDRNVETAFTKEAQELHDAVSRRGVEGVDQYSNEGYRGVGAYTGFVVPPNGGGKPMVTSTYRVIVPNDTGHGERWHPTLQVGNVPLGTGPRQKTWGMIVDNAQQDELADQGMGFIPEGVPPDAQTDIVGYTHGMTQAVVNCAMRHDASRPFEIAVGEKTTKLASCFACTLFMYGTGYPPSSIHIDRAESWVPMYETLAPEALDYTDAVMETTDRWRAFCTDVLRIGYGVLKKSRDTLVADGQVASLDALGAFLGAHTDKWTSANLILDALTVHDKESSRVLRSIK